MKDKIKLDNAASTVFAPQLVGLVTTIDRANQPNVATFAWIMSTSHDPELIAVSVSKARYTYECLTDEFVVNLPTKELVKEMWAVGTLSGRDVNKFEVAGLTPIPSEVVKPPRVAECPTHIECHIVDTLETGDHTIFVGEVVAKSGDFDAIKDGSLNVRIEPLFHLGGTKFLCGGERIDVDEIRPGEIAFKMRC